MNVKILLASLVVPFLFQAQVKNTARHMGYEQTSDMVSLNQKGYYLAIRNFMSLNLYCLDDNGETIYSMSLGELPWCEKPSISLTTDKKLIITGGTELEYCDYGSRIFHVYRLDTNGTVLNTFNLNGDVKGWAVQPSGSVLIYVNDELRYYSNVGNLISTNSPNISPDLGSSMELLNLQSGKLLISYTSNSYYRLRKASLDGSSLMDVLIPSPSFYLREGSDSSIYAISGGHIVKYSPKLTPVHTTTVLGQAGSIRVFTIHNDTIFAAGENAQRQFYYVVLDSALNVLHQVISNVEFSSPTGITVKSDKINIITTGLTASVQGQSFTGWFQTTKMGTLIATQDVGIVSVNLGQVFRLNSSLPAALVTDATVTVKNFGADTLKQVTINQFAYSNWPCYQLVGLLKPISVSIPPNATVAISTGTFYANVNASTSQAQICIFTSIPNGMNDENVQNDASCTSTIALGLGQYVMISGIKVFPNPASNYINIESPIRIETISISNSLGQKVREITLNGETGFSTEDLIPGVYFLNFRWEEGMYFGRIVIDR